MLPELFDIREPPKFIQPCTLRWRKRGRSATISIAGQYTICVLRMSLPMKCLVGIPLGTDQIGSANALCDPIAILFQAQEIVPFLDQLGRPIMRRADISRQQVR